MLQFTFHGLEYAENHDLDSSTSELENVQRSSDRSRGRNERCPAALSSRDRLCRCHQAFCSASILKFHLHTSVLARGKSANPGQQAVSPEHKLKGRWSSRRLRLWAASSESHDCQCPPTELGHNLLQPPSQPPKFWQGARLPSPSLFGRRQLRRSGPQPRGVVPLPSTESLQVSDLSDRCLTS